VAAFQPPPSAADRRRTVQCDRRKQIDAGNSYTTWNVGAGYAFNKHIAVGIRYTDTDAHDFGGLYRSHLVASEKLGF